jgi:hypothetical protein
MRSGREFHGADLPAVIKNGGVDAVGAAGLPCAYPGVPCRERRTCVLCREIPVWPGDHRVSSFDELACSAPWSIKVAARRGPEFQAQMRSRYEQ